MFVDTDHAGNVTAVYAVRQYRGQRVLADNDPKIFAFLSADTPPVSATDKIARMGLSVADLRELIGGASPGDSVLRPSGGGGDDYPAIQAAIATGRCDLGPGIFNLSNTLSVGGNLKMTGLGKLATFLRPPNGRPAISIVAPSEGYSTILEDFGILYSTFQSGIMGITVNARAGHEHTGFEARSVYIEKAGYGIDFIRASYWRMVNCEIQNSTNAAVLVRNVNHPDSGDALIQGCTFINPSITSGGAVGVLQFSGGGLKIVGCKINLFNQAYQLALDTGVNTCDLIMTGCSAESVGFSGPNAPILLQHPGGGGSFHSVIITGNQFNGWGYAAANIGSIVNLIGSGWCNPAQIVAAPNVIN